MQDDYFNVEALSASGAKLLLKSPAHYRYWKDNPKEPTPAMVFGTVVHALVLEPQRDLSNVCAIKTLNWTTKEGKEEKANLEASGLPIISQFDLDRAYRVRDAVWSMKQCEDLLTGCSIEENVQWTGYSSLVNCKAGIDAIGNNHIIDLKTCMDASPEGFAAQIRRFKYDLQAAHYLEAAVERDIHSFVFVAVETQPPYAVGIYKLDDNTLIRAFRSMDRIAATYKKCLETNYWPSYQSDITELVIPSFEKIDEDTIEAEDF